jgi:DNA-binding transcriptional LysR family regulator
MNEIDLRRADLNLLLVFQILLAERHVGRSAKRLLLTQSAVSHALGRLRSMFEDPLFVRHPKGIEPTARALALAPTIADILSRAQSLLASRAFDPTAAHSFTIATLDFMIPTVLLPLVERLRLVAPAVDIRVLPMDRQHVVTAFDRQEIDMAILSIANLPARIARVPLLKDRFVGIARRDHPQLRRKRLTTKAFAALPHLLVSLRGDPTGIADQPFDPLDALKRRVALTVPHLLAAPLIVANTDLVALVFERIARRYAAQLKLKIFEPPIALPEFTFDILTSAARASDSALRWLQSEVLRASGDPISS